MAPASEGLHLIRSLVLGEMTANFGWIIKKITRVAFLDTSQASQNEPLEFRLAWSHSCLVIVNMCMLSLADYLGSAVKSLAYYHPTLVSPISADMNFFLVYLLFVSRRQLPICPDTHLALHIEAFAAL